MQRYKTRGNLLVEYESRHPDDPQLEHVGGISATSDRGRKSGIDRPKLGESPRSCALARS